MAASSSSAAQAASLVKEAVELGLLPEENNYTASGYAGVTEVKGKYQARVFDRRRKRQRAIPGLHATALQAALALARAKQLLLDEGDEGSCPWLAGLAGAPRATKFPRGLAARSLSLL